MGSKAKLVLRFRGVTDSLWYMCKSLFDVLGCTRAILGILTQCA